MAHRELWTVPGSGLLRADSLYFPLAAVAHVADHLVALLKVIFLH